MNDITLSDVLKSNSVVERRSARKQLRPMGQNGAPSNFGGPPPLLEPGAITSVDAFSAHRAVEIAARGFPDARQRPLRENPQRYSSRAAAASADDVANGDSAGLSRADVLSVGSGSAESVRMPFTSSVHVDPRSAGVSAAPPAGGSSSEQQQQQPGNLLMPADFDRLMALRAGASTATGSSSVDRAAPTISGAGNGHNDAVALSAVTPADAALVGRFLRSAQSSHKAEALDVLRRWALTGAAAAGGGVTGATPVASSTATAVTSAGRRQWPAGLSAPAVRTAFFPYLVVPGPASLVEATGALVRRDFISAAEERRRGRRQSDVGGDQDEEDAEADAASKQNPEEAAALDVAAHLLAIVTGAAADAHNPRSATGGATVAAAALRFWTAALDGEAAAIASGAAPVVGWPALHAAGAREVAAAAGGAPSVWGDVDADVAAVDPFNMTVAPGRNIGDAPCLTAKISATLTATTTRVGALRELLPTDPMYAIAAGGAASALLEAIRSAHAILAADEPDALRLSKAGFPVVASLDPTRPTPERSETSGGFWSIVDPATGALLAPPPSSDSVASILGHATDAQRAGSIDVSSALRTILCSWRALATLAVHSPFAAAHICALAAYDEASQLLIDVCIHSPYGVFRAATRPTAAAVVTAAGDTVTVETRHLWSDALLNCLFVLSVAAQPSRLHARTLHAQYWERLVFVVLELLEAAASTEGGETREQVEANRSAAAAASGGDATNVVAAAPPTAASSTIEWIWLTLFSIMRNFIRHGACDAEGTSRWLMPALPTALKRGSYGGSLVLEALLLVERGADEDAAEELEDPRNAQMSEEDRRFVREIERADRTLVTTAQHAWQMEEHVLPALLLAATGNNSGAVADGVLVSASPSNIHPFNLAAVRIGTFAHYLATWLERCTADTTAATDALRAMRMGDDSAAIETTEQNAAVESRVPRSAAVAPVNDDETDADGSKKRAPRLFDTIVACARALEVALVALGKARTGEGEEVTTGAAPNSDAWSDCLQSLARVAVAAGSVYSPFAQWSVSVAAACAQHVLEDFVAVGASARRPAGTSSATSYPINVGLAAVVEALRAAQRMLGEAAGDVSADIANAVAIPDAATDEERQRIESQRESAKTVVRGLVQPATIMQAAVLFTEVTLDIAASAADAAMNTTANPLAGGATTSATAAAAASVSAALAPVDAMLTCALPACIAPPLYPRFLARFITECETGTATDAVDSVVAEEADELRAVGTAAAWAKSVLGGSAEVAVAEPMVYPALARKVLSAPDGGRFFDAMASGCAVPNDGEEALGAVASRNVALPLVAGPQTGFRWMLPRSLLDQRAPVARFETCSWLAHVACRMRFGLGSHAALAAAAARAAPGCTSVWSRVPHPLHFAVGATLSFLVGGGPARATIATVSAAPGAATPSAYVAASIAADAAATMLLDAATTAMLSTRDPPPVLASADFNYASLDAVLEAAQERVLIAAAASTAEGAPAWATATAQGLLDELLLHMLLLTLCTLSARCPPRAAAMLFNEFWLKDVAVLERADQLLRETVAANGNDDSSTHPLVPPTCAAARAALRRIATVVPATTFFSAVVGPRLTTTAGGATTTTPAEAEAAAAAAASRKRASAASERERLDCGTTLAERLAEASARVTPPPLTSAAAVTLNTAEAPLSAAFSADPEVTPSPLLRVAGVFFALLVARAVTPFVRRSLLEAVAEAAGEMPDEDELDHDDGSSHATSGGRGTTTIIGMVRACARNVETAVNGVPNGTLSQWLAL